MDAAASLPIQPALVVASPSLLRFLHSPALRRLAPLGLTAGAALLLSACAGVGDVSGGGKASQIIVSVQDQKMTVIRDGGGRVSYPISTSKFGLNGRRRSYTTPTGNLAIAQKVGGGAPTGAVFHSRVRTGEIVKVNSPGRDPIVTRILALRGLESGNQDALSRGIYIHGTPEESLIGTPASYGCIRMRSRDVIALYDMVDVGTRVRVIDSDQRNAVVSSGVDLTPRRPENVSTAPTTAVAAASETSGGQSSATTTEVGETNAAAPASTTALVASRTVAPRATKPAAVQVVVNNAPAGGSSGSQKWAGSPSNLLADRSAAAPTAAAVSAGATAPRRGAVNAKPTPSGSTRPVVNNTDATESPRSRDLGRAALDSL